MFEVRELPERTERNAIRNNFVKEIDRLLNTRSWEVRRDGITVGVVFDEKLAESLKPRTIDTFIKDCCRTESPAQVIDHEDFQTNVDLNRILHAAMGCVTESGEMADSLKKVLFYGKPLDIINLKEEAGDILWYLALLFDELGCSFEEPMAMIIAKLKKRYPQKFNSKDALNRDLEGERQILESHK